MDTDTAFMVPRRKRKSRARRVLSLVGNTLLILCALIQGLGMAYFGYLVAQALSIYIKNHK